tara:strand:+ start:106 stop:723 length:618 start_codon:yes stop_codon:yes gene_type:complete
MHVAIILDGNRRYGKEHHVDGHASGFDAMVTLLTTLVQKPIDIVSMFVWSTHNWKRTVVELQNFRRLVQSRTKPLLALAQTHNIAFRVISTDTSHFSQVEQASLRDLEEQTKDNQGMVCNLCCSYSGHEEIQLAADLGPVQDNLLIPEPVDLFIRTAEQRLSDFLLWQSAFAEIYFWDGLFPSFTPNDFEDIWSWWKERDRRFGQ